MNLDIALILGIDGLATGAIYVLMALGLVLIFSVTRVIFVPFGDIAVFAAFSLAALENQRVPPTIKLVAVTTPRGLGDRDRQPAPSRRYP